MKKCILTIELLSDLCVSDGSVYNSKIDTDICYDRYGVPFIPAKRIRGCLRECAVELNDWGDNIHIEELFGEAGAYSNRAKLRLGNAYLSDIDEIREFVNEHPKHVMTHTQNVLDLFSSIRTQTSIDYDTGMADKGSLRTMRVANKGLVFVADLEVDDSYFDELCRCGQILRHMGIARTRGLGEVKVSIQESSSIKEKAYNQPIAGKNKLTYEIELKEPVIIKSINGGESKTQDYIEGSKILGLIAQNLPKFNKDYIDFMNEGTLICSNAYISQNGERYVEVPGYIYSIKNNGSKFINKLFDDGTVDEKRQLNQFKHKYIRTTEKGIEPLEVLTEKSYHHRRPEDKSIGRAKANEDGNADFYQIDSIAEGQTFMGTITGSEAQIKIINDILSEDTPFYLGYSKSSEYGKVKIRVIEDSQRDDKKEIVSAREKTNSLVVHFVSPTIVYNNKAAATTDYKDLVEEIIATLKIEERPIKVTPYLRYDSVGGWNVTWGLKKPTIPVFDKGTAIRLDFETDVEVEIGRGIYFGERTTEGFGEAIVLPVSKCGSKREGVILEAEETQKETTLDVSDGIAEQLCKPIFNSFVKKNAIDLVKIDEKNLNSKKEIYRPTVSNMLLMLQETDEFNELENMVEDRFEKKSEGKQDKYMAAKTILSTVSQASESIADDFCKEYRVANLKADGNEVKLALVKEYLVQAKYKMRGADR